MSQGTYLAIAVIALTISLTGASRTSGSSKALRRQRDEAEAEVTAFRAVIGDIRDYLDECDEEGDVSWVCIVDDIRMFLADLEAKP